MGMDGEFLWMVFLDGILGWYFCSGFLVQDLNEEMFSSGTFGDRQGWEWLGLAISRGLPGGCKWWNVGMGLGGMG